VLKRDIKLQLTNSWLQLNATGLSVVTVIENGSVTTVGST